MGPSLAWLLLYAWSTAGYRSMPGLLPATALCCYMRLPHSVATCGSRTL